MVRPQIVLFGDSITQYSFQVDQKGWGALLADRFQRKLDVVLRGFAGYNTRWARLIVDKILPYPAANPPALVTVFFGANDAVDSNIKQDVSQHVPLAEYRENLHQIITYLKKQSDSTYVVLITPPPVDEKNLIKYGRIKFGDTSGIPTRRNELTKLYAEECVKVGQEMDVPVLNLWSIFQETPDWQEKMLCDGLHLSADGNVKVFEEVAKIIDELGYHPGDKPLDFPAYTDLGQDPVATLDRWLSEKF